MSEQAAFYISVGLGLICLAMLCALWTRRLWTANENRIQKFASSAMPAGHVWTGAWLLTVPKAKLDSVQNDAERVASESGSQPDDVLMIWIRNGVSVFSHVSGPQMTSEEDAVDWLKRASDDLTRLELAGPWRQANTSVLALVYASVRPPAARVGDLRSLRTFIEDDCLGAAFVSCAAPKAGAPPLTSRTAVYAAITGTVVGAAGGLTMFTYTILAGRGTRHGVTADALGPSASTGNASAAPQPNGVSDVAPAPIATLPPTATATAGQAGLSVSTAGATAAVAGPAAPEPGARQPTVKPAIASTAEKRGGAVVTRPPTPPNPSGRPTQPPVQPTQPSAQSQPSAQPTQPPAQPSAQPVQPPAQPTQSPVKPHAAQPSIKPGPKRMFD